MICQMKTKTENKTVEKTNKKRISKTWLTALKYAGTGKILDMRAVLK